MGWLLETVVNATKKALSMVRPKSGQIVVPRREDSDHEVFKDLSPKRVGTAIQSLTDGDLTEAMELFEQLVDRDGHLKSVVSTRRMAVTGLDWGIVPATAVDNASEKLATETADYVRETLESIDAVPELLEHLAKAHGMNISVGELVWEGSGDGLRLVDIVAIEHTRLKFISRKGGGIPELRILTAEEPSYGIAVSEFPNKFVKHVPETKTGNPARGGLMVASMTAVLGKRMSLHSWLIYGEVFGMPVRTAKYGPGATTEEKTEALKMLKTLGTDAVGIFSEAVQIEFNERKGNAQPPYERIAAFMNGEMSKAWLGQTLTTEIGETGGAMAAAEVHNDLREDLRDDDIAKERRTIGRCIIRPLVRLRFGPDAPIPVFERIIPDTTDQKLRAEVFATAITEIGIDVSEAQVRAELQLNDTDGLEDDDKIAARPGSRTAVPFKRAVPVVPDHVLLSHADRKQASAAQADARVLAARAAEVTGVAAEDLLEPLVAAMEGRGDEPLTAESIDEIFLAAFDEISPEQLAELRRQLELSAQLRGRLAAQNVLKAKGRPVTTSAPT